MKWKGKKTFSAMLALAMDCSVGASGILMASAGSAEIIKDPYTSDWYTTNPVGPEDEFENVGNGEASYTIPVKLKTIGINYQVSLEWGDFDLVYDATAASGSEWGNSFDGTNNIVTATNSGKKDIQVAMTYNNFTTLDSSIDNDVENLHLGLTETNSQYEEGEDIGGQWSTLSASTGSDSSGTKSEYLNLRNDYAAPLASISESTKIGTITISVKPGA